MSGWTEERIETFRKLYADRLAFSQIASEMNRLHGLRFSRNACIGKAHRLGLPGRETNRPAPERAQVRRITKTGKNSWAFGKATRELKPAPPPKAIPVPTRQHACTLLDLGNTTCRWPIWGDHAPAAEQFFCGEPRADVAGGRPYCAYHARAAYGARRAPQNISEAERMRRRQHARTYFAIGSAGGPEMMQAAE